MERLLALVFLTKQLDLPVVAGLERLTKGSSTLTLPEEKPPLAVGRVKLQFQVLGGPDGPRIVAEYRGARLSWALYLGFWLFLGATGVLVLFKGGKFMIWSLIMIAMTTSAVHFEVQTRVRQMEALKTLFEHRFGRQI